jgi:hypothetical protein
MFTGTAPAPPPPQVPVSCTPVKGTPWSEVKCEDGRVYYVHSESEVSQQVRVVQCDVTDVAMRLLAYSVACYT